MDYSAFHMINQLAGHYALLDSLMKATAKYGVVMFAVPLLFLWFRGGISGKKAALLAMLAMAIALLAGQVITHIYMRPRPFMVHTVNQLVNHSGDPSFPSDHTLFSFGLAGVILLENRRWGIAAIAFACLVAFSRVFTGLHYPGDVIGGALIGLVCGLVVWRVRKIFDPVLDFLIGIARRLKLA